MLITFVDDLGVAAEHEDEVDRLIVELEKMGFVLTKEGTFAEFLGIQHDKTDDHEFTLTQQGLIDKILTSTDMQDCRPNHLPTAQTTLSSDPEGEPMCEEWNMKSIVGMLLYLSGNTRPDIAFAVSQVCRFTVNPKQSHATAVKTIIRYL